MAKFERLLDCTVQDKSHRYTLAGITIVCLLIGFCVVQMRGCAERQATERKTEIKAKKSIDRTFRFRFGKDK